MCFSCILYSVNTKRKEAAFSLWKFTKLFFIPWYRILNKIVSQYPFHLWMLRNFKAKTVKFWFYFIEVTCILTSHQAKSSTSACSVWRGCLMERGLTWASEDLYSFSPSATDLMWFHLTNTPRDSTKIEIYREFIESNQNLQVIHRSFPIDRHNTCLNQNSLSKGL